MGVIDFLIMKFVIIIAVALVGARTAQAMSVVTEPAPTPPGDVTETNHIFTTEVEEPHGWFTDEPDHTDYPDWSTDEPDHTDYPGWFTDEPDYFTDDPDWFTDEPDWFTDEPDWITDEPEPEEHVSLECMVFPALRVMKTEMMTEAQLIRTAPAQVVKQVVMRRLGAL